MRVRVRARVRARVRVRVRVRVRGAGMLAGLTQPDAYPDPARPLTQTQPDP